MNRRLALFALAALVAAAVSLAATGAARADVEYLAPYCAVTANNPFTDYPDPSHPEWNNVKGWGTIRCEAGDSPWAAQWWIEVCLQKWVRPDDQYYNVGECGRMYAWGDMRAPTGAAYGNAYCNESGYGEYRTWVHAQWFSDYWRDVYTVSNVTWNCTG
jgi:hypothetical protein